MRNWFSHAEEGPIALSDELIRAIDRVQHSTALKVVVLQGPDGETCAGDDITEMHTWGDANGVMRRVRLYQTMANASPRVGEAPLAWPD
jgi:enoyl-CoA hydratase